MSESGSGEPVDSNAPNDKELSECPTCGELFQSGRGVSSHHVQAHGESIAGVELTCEYCSKTYRVKSGEEERSRFCSKGCKADWESENRTGEDAPAYKGKEIVICEYCECEIKVVPAAKDSTRFCSVDCKAKWQSENRSGKNHPSWSGGMVTVECEYCGSEYEEKPCRVERTRFCSQDCLYKWRSESRSGENSPLWRGGYSSYRGKNWLEQRSKAIERDNSCCQRCGDEDSLQVHHIEPFRTFENYKEANKLENLITLCTVCHRKVEKMAPLLPPSIR